MCDSQLPNTIYSDVTEVLRELKLRRMDVGLKKKVQDFFDGNQFLDIDQGPFAMLSRSIATPNREMDCFIRYAKHLRMEPLFLEYPDKFVAKNPDKYHLCRLYVAKEFIGSGIQMVNSVKAIDFNENEGKKFSDIKTKWGESLVDMHHRILFQEFPSMLGTIIDFSDWFNSTRDKAEQYYLYFFSLFILNGVLMENYLFDDPEENAFIHEKILPSFLAVYELFGVKPLVLRLLPERSAKNRWWMSYNSGLEKRLSGESIEVYSREKTISNISFQINKNGCAGLIANNSFNRGEVIGNVSGLVTSNPIINLEINQEYQLNEKIIQISNSQFLELDEIWNGINHSCSPNAGMDDTRNLIALQYIAQGEEITIDLATSILSVASSPYAKLQCRCGSFECRETIGSIHNVHAFHLLKHIECNALPRFIVVELVKSNLTSKIIKHSLGKLDHSEKAGLPKITII